MTKARLVLLSLLLAALAFAQDATKIKAGDSVRLRCEEEATLNKESSWYSVDQNHIVVISESMEIDIRSVSIHRPSRKE